MSVATGLILSYAIIAVGGAGLAWFAIHNRARADKEHTESNVKMGHA